MNSLSVFDGKRVLVTGHTGFKGSWLSFWLHHLGAKVFGLSLAPSTNPSHYTSAAVGNLLSEEYLVDLRDADIIREIIRGIRPDFVFHLAAQALVRRAYTDPVATYAINLMGTVNVLEGLRVLEHPCVAVLITSDKCYENVEWEWGYRETDPLGGADPYSASKGAAELAIRSYVRSYLPDDGKVRLGVARAGNVIGGGDWAEDRIIPDCVRAWSRGEVVSLRNPGATRPWQHVLEPLSGYLNLAMALHDSPKLHGEPFNFGPSSQQNHSVLELVQRMSVHWDYVRWKDVSGATAEPYESSLLKLSCDKALHFLRWHAVLDFEDTVRLTAEWYRAYYQQSARIAATTCSQIEDYMAIAKKQGLVWTR